MGKEKEVKHFVVDWYKVDCFYKLKRVLMHAGPEFNMTEEDVAPIRDLLKEAKK
jgi:hypothetical protein